VTEGEGQRVGRVGWGLRVKPQGVTHDIGDLPLLRAPVPYHRRLNARWLDLHDLASPTAERHEKGAARLRKGEGLRKRPVNGVSMTTTSGHTTRLPSCW
jgi:hypothetical protein